MLTKSRRFLLRDATTQAHQTLEEYVGSIDTLPAYRRYLRGSHRHRAPIEAAMARLNWPRSFGDWRPLALASEIERDLIALGEPVDTLTPVTLSNDVSDLVGLCYVLEGASLGAQILARQADALGLDAESGAGHLAIQRRGIDSWRKFIELVELVGDLDVPRSCAAANAAFAGAEKAFRDR